MSWRHQLALVACSAEELCGLLYGDELLVIENVAADRAVEYTMNHAQQAAVMAKRGWPDAVWHTHPRGTRAPSNIDLVTMPSGIRMIIATAGWIGTWLDGRQVQEARMGSQTNSIGETYRDEDGQWHWHILSAGGQEVEHSGEPFGTQQEAVAAMYNKRPEIKPADVTPDSSSASDAMTGGVGGGTSGTAGGTPTGPAGTGSSPTGPPATPTP